MSLEDQLDLADIVNNRSETKSDVKFHYLSRCTYTNTIIHDFRYADVELHAEFPKAPPLPNPDASFGGVGDTTKGYSMAPIRAIAYEEEPMHAGGPPMMMFFRFEEKHLYSTSFLRNFVGTLEDDREIVAADRESLLSELQ